MRDRHPTPIAINSEPILWYDHPAARWQEALPVGNGRLGGMVFGGALEERIHLNEDSVWSGSAQDADNPEGKAALARIRELLLARNYAEGEKLAFQKMICRGAGSGKAKGADLPFGSYQTLGDSKITLLAATGTPTAHRRELNLDSAIATTTFQLGGARYTREVFASHPDQVLVVRLSADVSGRLSLDVGLSRLAAAVTSAAGDDQLLMTGQTPDGRGGKGLRFAARLRAVPQGGTVSISNGSLQVRNADAVTLLLAARTNYNRASPPTYLRGDPDARSAADLAAVARTSYATLRDRHVADHQALFRRVTLDLGGHAARSMPTDQRRATFGTGAPDVDPLATYFQYGRYLLIASSRPGIFPPTSRASGPTGCTPPWNADYHSNINLQMNYWPAEVTNLSELPPAALRSHRATCAAPAGARPRCSTAPAAGSRTPSPTSGASPRRATVASWGSSTTAAPGSAEHLWEHYLFTQDAEFLRRAYPIMREAAAVLSRHAGDGARSRPAGQRALESRPRTSSSCPTARRPASRSAPRWR